jgi:hypothetical protein
MIETSSHSQESVVSLAGHLNSVPYSVIGTSKLPCHSHIDIRVSPDASAFHVCGLSYCYICQRILRMITNAPWYMSNQTIHVDLHVPFIKDVIQEKCIKHHAKLGHHSNAILQPLLAEQQRRRLKKIWLDLIDG